MGYSKFYEDGDKPNKLLATLLKGSRVCQTITKIWKQDSSIVTDHRQINDTFKDFYTELYGSQLKTNSNKINDFLNKLNIPAISPTHKNRLDHLALGNALGQMVFLQIF